MPVYEDLLSLKLHYLANHLEEFLIQMNKTAMKPQKMIERIIELELIERAQRRTSYRLQQAKIGKFKAISDFDWEFPEEIDRKTIEELLIGEFVKESKNIIMAGPQGIGKTMIAKNIAYQAALHGHSVYFTTASKLVIDLGAQESGAALQRRLKHYEKPKLLGIDEVGYLSFDSQSADFLFEIINRRYEKGSIVITTNLPFKEWHTIFPGSPCVTAMIDRLTHHAEILKISGPSFRTSEAKQKKGSKTNANKTK